MRYQYGKTSFYMLPTKRLKIRPTTLAISFTLLEQNENTESHVTHLVSGGIGSAGKRWSGSGDIGSSGPFFVQ